MKVLFSADEHLYLRKKRVPEEWLKNRFLAYVDLMSKTVVNENIDLVIHGGDFFDKYPTLEELALYFEYVKTISDLAPCLIIDGNHEAAKGKGKSWLSVLKAPTSSISSNKFQIITEPCTIHGIDFLPYKDLKTHEFTKKNKILVTHVRGEIPPHVKAEVDLKKFADWTIVFAGDLHAHSNSQHNIVYPGSPMTTSFHKNLTRGENGIIVFDTEDPWKFKWIEANLPQLLKVSVKSEEDITDLDDGHFRLFEIEGTMEKVAKVKTSNNVIKKVVREDEEVDLLLSGTSDIREELSRYFKEILKIEDANKIMEFFNDYIA